MAAIKDYLALGKLASNELCIERRRYSFADDAGATGALDIFGATDAIVVTHFHSTVKTTCTSGGSATLKVGPTGDDDKFMNTTQGAVASLSAGTTIVAPAVEGTPNALPLPWPMAAGDKILQTIGTATLTAGVVEYCVGYVKA